MAMSWLIVIAATLAILIPLIATRLRRAQDTLHAILADHYERMEHRAEIPDETVTKEVPVEYKPVAVSKS
jgi:hypothetical protein